MITYLILIGHPFIKEEYDLGNVVSIGHALPQNLEPALPFGGNQAPPIFHGFH